MGRKKDVPSLRQIVEGRIDILLKKAVETYLSRPRDAKRYVRLAKKLSMRHRIAMGAVRKRLFCKKCTVAFIENKTYGRRIEGEWEIYICECGARRKFYLGRE